MGEWKFGSLLGLPYFSEVFVKNPNMAVIEQLFREQILSVEEVVGVEDIRIQINKRLQNLHGYFQGTDNARGNRRGGDD